MVWNVQGVPVLLHRPVTNMGSGCIAPDEFPATGINYFIIAVSCKLSPQDFLLTV